MPSTLVLIMGPAGVGKSTAIRGLVEARLCRYIAPITTRPLRVDEFDKRCVPSEEYERLAASGFFLFDNSLYGYRYGTPKQELLDALKCWPPPVLDWPVEYAASMHAAENRQTLAIYMRPSSAEFLRHRLSQRKGPGDDERFIQAMDEVRRVSNGQYLDVIDSEIVVDKASEGAVIQAIAAIMHMHIHTSVSDQPSSGKGGE